jgi:hypothetical protein
MALALAALPASATAKPSRGVLGNSLFSGFELRGSNGYRIQVITAGRQLVLLGASKGQVAASYAVEGNIHGDRIEARLGSLGRISVRFVSSSRSQRRGSRSKRCTDPFDLVQKGRFLGTIKFAGERGYTKVDSRGARGFVFGLPENPCGTQSATSSLALPPTRLTTHLVAVAKGGRKSYSLEASRFGGDQISLSASIEERRPRMDIFRVASTTVGGENAFVSSGVGRHPAHATLSPPKPFSGTGVFEEGSPPSSSWRGSIAVWLPGAGKVRMAGERFASSLCRRPIKSSGCSPFPTVQRDFERAQESGSQSHALREVMLSWSRYLRNSASSAGSTP